MGIKVFLSLIQYQSGIIVYEISNFEFREILQGLTKLLADNAPKSMKEQKFESYFGRKIAIDASMSIYQFLVCSLPSIFCLMAYGQLRSLCGKKNKQLT